MPRPPPRLRRRLQRRRWRSSKTVRIDICEREQVDDALDDGSRMLRSCCVASSPPSAHHVIQHSPVKRSPQVVRCAQRFPSCSPHHSCGKLRFSLSPQPCAQCVSCTLMLPMHPAPAAAPAASSQRTSCPMVCWFVLAQPCLLRRSGCRSLRLPLRGVRLAPSSALCSSSPVCMLSTTRSVTHCGASCTRRFCSACGQYGTLTTSYPNAFHPGRRVRRRRRRPQRRLPQLAQLDVTNSGHCAWKRMPLAEYSACRPRVRALT